MLHTITRFLDLVFPPSEATLLLRNQPKDVLCKFILKQKTNDTTTLLVYKDTLVRAAITSTKFHNNHEAARILHRVLVQYLSIYEVEEVGIIPIPLAPKRERERGHNQVDTILRAGDLPAHVHICDKVLVRSKNTPPQTSLGRSDRLENMTDAFVVKPNFYLPPKITRLILLDDVTTTGATLAAAKATLLPHIKNVPINCLALAH